jgi:hypothetical protein
MTIVEFCAAACGEAIIENAVDEDMFNNADTGIFAGVNCALADRRSVEPCIMDFTT